MPPVCQFLDKNGNRCVERAYFGGKTESALRCKGHKKDDDIRTAVKNNICQYLDCIKQSTYGDPNNGKKTHCSGHGKELGYVDVAHKKCIFPGCRLIPSFGDPLTGKSNYCSTHGKELGYKTLDKRICEFLGCTTQSCYGDPNIGKRNYCSVHGKELGYVDVANKKCLFPECQIRACYGNPNMDKVEYCATHGKELGYENLTNKRCENSDCKTIASYGNPLTGKISHCSIHGKALGYINLDKRKCEDPDCKTQPTYGNPDTGKISHCSIHGKALGYIDLCHNHCRSNDEPYNFYCGTLGNKSYDYFCCRCFAHHFPVHPKTATIRKKSKELKVVEYINSVYPPKDDFKGFIHDKPLYIDLDGGCCVSKRRIDLRTLIGNTLLCIEIDENQAGYHNKPDRYDDLFMDFSGKYIFLRINPDKYKDHKGLVKNPRFDTRMALLTPTINYMIGRINKGENNELLEIYHLYYNGFDGDIKQTL